MKTPLIKDFKYYSERMAVYCAGAEHCNQDVKLKLKQAKVEGKDINTILKKLNDEGYIDEMRFAKAFVRGKFRNNKWGRLMIQSELRKKNIPAAIIKSALGEIKEEDYKNTLQSLINNKLKLLGGKTIENSQKAARYALSKGFEPELIFRILGNIDEN